MRICLIGPVPPFRGGIAKYCYSIAKELEKRHEILLLSYKRQYPQFLYGRKSQIDPDMDRDTILHEFRNLSYDIDSVNIASWLDTSKRIAEFRPDAVILPWWVTYWAPMYAYLLSSLKKRGIRIVFLCINVYEHEDNAVKKLLTRFILRKADSIIVHSGQEQLEALKINPKASVKMHLLPLFEYNRQNTEKNDDTLHLLFFGFVRKYKGLDTLLQAVAILKNRDISLKIAGEFWSGKEEYLKIIRDLDIAAKVEIVDRYLSEDEMCTCFSRADVVVLPYRESRTSGVIATAYGFGKPVLATNVGGFHEIIEDGCTGKLVPPDDPQSLADGIEWFSKNRHINFTDNIETFASRDMSWSSLAATIEELAST